MRQDLRYVSDTREIASLAREEADAFLAKQESLKHLSQESVALLARSFLRLSRTHERASHIANGIDAGSTLVTMFAAPILGGLYLPATGDSHGFTAFFSFAGGMIAQRLGFISLEERLIEGIRKRIEGKAFRAFFSRSAAAGVDLRPMISLEIERTAAFFSLTVAGLAETKPDQAEVLSGIADKLPKPSPRASESEYAAAFLRMLETRSAFFDSARGLSLDLKPFEEQFLSLSAEETQARHDAENLLAAEREVRAKLERVKRPQEFLLVGQTNKFDKTLELIQKLGGHLFLKTQVDELYDDIYPQRGELNLSILDVQPLVRRSDLVDTGRWRIRAVLEVKAGEHATEAPFTAEFNSRTMSSAADILGEESWIEPFVDGLNSASVALREKLACEGLLTQPVIR